MRLFRNKERGAKTEENIAQYNRIIQLLPETTRDRVREIIDTLKGQITPSDGFDVDSISDSVKQILGHLAAADIDVLVSLIMFELWQSEENALSELLKEMDRMNELKQKQRERLDSLKKKKRETEPVPSGSSIRGPTIKRLKPNPRLGTKTSDTQKDYATMQTPSSVSHTSPPPPPDTSEKSIDNLEELEGKLDSLNEQSEILSLKLQMTMDRRDKYMSTLAQIMKKISTTQDTLIQNIK
jgi:hypothetical protein